MHMLELDMQQVITHLLSIRARCFGNACSNEATQNHLRDATLGLSLGASQELVHLTRAGSTLEQIGNLHDFSVP